jgi:hypothetical protein
MQNITAMNKRLFKYSSVILLIGLVWAGCKDLEDMNHDPTKGTTTPTKTLLTNAEKSAMDFLYSGLQNGKIAMYYSQYWAANDKANDSRYLLDEGVNNSLWSSLYANTLRDLEEIIRLNRAHPPQGETANQIAIASILKVWVYQILTDCYGDIPYTSTMQVTTDITPKYDDAKTIYLALADTLQAQIALLDNTQSSFTTGDIIYNGNVDSWKKLGNALLLRLAIRMADADKPKAQSIIEASYINAISSNTENAEFKYLNQAPNKFPYNDSERELTEFFVSGTLVDYLKSVNDPRLPIFARLPKDESIKDYVGMPYGTDAANPNRKTQDKYSFPGKKIYAADMTGILITYPEVAFILAEAAARGMNVGADAGTYYTKGVTASLEYWGVKDDNTINTYLAKVPYNAADWRNNIGSQKWLALYPQGFQGWFERTRLHFKKPGGADLFITPVDGSLDQHVTVVPYRLTYPVSEQQQNKANYDAASQAIGGDTKAIKLWWNKF